MAQTPDNISKGPELVIGLVGALGTDLDLVFQCLEGELQSVGYETRLVHITKYIRELDKWKNLPLDPLDTYIEKLQDAGNQIREELELGDALARLAIGAIRNFREVVNGEPKQPIPRCAYIIRQLKHPKEVSLLRSIYGNSFFLVAAYSPRDLRIQALATKIAGSYNSLQAHNFREHAERLMKRDEQESGNVFGQNVRDTFPQSDVFFDASNADLLRKSVERFTELVFGNPFHTPYPDEFAMFHANAAALRSADLARQVGAVITSSSGDVIAVGTNEVPKAGGGLYWAGDYPDARDFVIGRNRSQEMRENALGDILRRLQNNGWFQSERKNLSPEELIKEALPIMKDTRLMGIGEFGRTVHAEMAALLDAARRGIAVQGQTLYTTTFPCHNCARHIIAAGIHRVVYVEPYPKSLASVLHSDSIVIESCHKVDKKVIFEPFVGIAPRKYIQLFSMSDRKGVDGKILAWRGHGAKPRYTSLLAHLGYIDREIVVVDEFRQKLTTKNR